MSTENCCGEYCSNDECAEYSVKKIKEVNYCATALEKHSATIIQAAIRGSTIKNMLNPSNYIDKKYLTEDNGIIKYILKEGSDDTPNNGQIVKAHYTGKLLNGTKFDSSIDRNEPFEFTLGIQQVIKLWDLGFASMKKGEKAILIGTSKYCYGENGSPPVIPPDSILCFEVELLDFYDKPKEIFEMTPEEKIDHMIKFKNEAKELFELKDYQNSYNLFKKSLDYLCDEKHEEKINLLINLSICSARLNDWIKSIEHADLAVIEDEKNIKALYRLAISLYKTNQFDYCIPICKEILLLDEDNAQAQCLLRNSMLQKKKEYNKEKALYSKMF
jgi:peptidylprolyl isomerase